MKSKTEINLKYTPDPNIADIEVSVEGTNLVIEYPTNSNFDNAEASIKFNNFYDYRYGAPNDEGFFIFYKSTFDYPALDFDLNKLYEVDGLQNEFGMKNAEVLKNKDYKHYIFFIKEGTFECIAKGCEIL